MSIAFSIFVLLLSSPTVTASNSNGTAIVGWVGDPNGRGTFGLVSSCILTLGLCVWSAMHLNVPPHNESQVRFWTRNFKWGFVGVVAPELLVFAAWRQYNSAKTLHVEVQKSLDIQKPGQGKDESQRSGSESNEPTHAWTMVHSFYAGMGGFVLEPDADGTHLFIPRAQRLTLTARGVALLARCGHLPNIPRDDIKDKSKADGLAKSLVIVQALWIIIQTIGRVVADLPVTLLEVNTLGHVLCALLVYLLWWHKPRLVKEPTRLEGDWVRPLCAYMYMSSQVSGWRSSHAGILHHTWYEPELSALAFFPTGSQDGNTALKHSTVPFQNFRKTPDTNEAISASTDNLSSFGPRPGASTSLLSSSIAEQGSDAMQLTRWRLAAEAVRAYPPILRFATEPNDSETLHREWLEPLTEELVSVVAPNWPGEDLLRGTGGLIMGMVLWFASMAYGGVHLAAWNDYFPTETEAWMWRSSAIYITWSGGLWLTMNLLARLSKPINRYWDNILARKSHWINYVILGTLCSVCGVAYAFARIFLVVEAFISIRQLPAEAYDTPNWTEVIPHL